ncbi:MAG: hypothetical protein CFE29_05765 [Bradyrhizobiaceae bacterium PARB1]|jgi:hypothetical protein|nr:MAG: hypothetical protein CFE29_05765 [Bradyrhizobiaceae bacterium PARB1]
MAFTLRHAGHDKPDPKQDQGAIAMLNTALIVIWMALGLCLVPIIFVSLGLWASTKVEDPKEYQ